MKKIYNLIDMIKHLKDAKPTRIINPTIGQLLAGIWLDDIITPPAPPVPVWTGLKFAANQNNSTITYVPSTVTTAEYSLDNGQTWVAFDNQTVTLNQGDEICVRGVISGDQDTDPGQPDYAKFGMTGSIAASGNIMSLYNYTNFETNLIIGYDYAFVYVFEGCTSLTTPPQLPATTLTDGCYGMMFNGCTSLATAPVLPATTLAEGCCAGMFVGCTSLTTAPQLPATTLADYCYSAMFSGCTSMATAPTLPATTLSTQCYTQMFNGCTLLTTAPTLYATTLADYCCLAMFEGCTSLTTAPTLPATTLADYCYEFMFNGCTSLTTPPVLPATTLADYCYTGMFLDCTSLSTAPQLPATTLANNCYQSMFDGCISLTIAPVLPATTLVARCYAHMFSGCTSLAEVTSYADDISATDCLDNWLDNVAYSGDFYNEGTAVYTRDASGVPATWTLHPEPVPAWAGLRFEIEGNSIFMGDTYNINYGNLFQYRVNDEDNWHPGNFQMGTLNDGDYVDIRGTLSGGTSGPSGLQFSFNSIGTKIYIKGNIMSLYDKDNWELLTTITKNSAFYQLFGDSASEIDASDLNLAATTLANASYMGMFVRCTSLVSAPQLPAGTLAQQCYQAMFEGCTSLTTAPQLQATTLEQQCYQAMFSGCTALSTVYQLPATTLAPSCYTSMFEGCTSLATAPTIAATTMAGNACNSMFAGCTSLVTPPQSLSSLVLYANCYYNMFAGCTTLATAPTILATTMADSACYRMFYNCDLLATAPILHTATLARQCYYQMFYGCENLTSVTSYANDISAYQCLVGWLSNVSGTGDFYNYGNATYPAGASGIPNGWTEHT